MCCVAAADALLTGSALPRHSRAVQLMALTTDPGYMAYYPPGQEVRQAGRARLFGRDAGHRARPHACNSAVSASCRPPPPTSSQAIPRATHFPLPLSSPSFFSRSRHTEHQRADGGDQQRVHPADCAAGHVLNHHLRSVSGGRGKAWRQQRVCGASCCSQLAPAGRQAM